MTRHVIIATIILATASCRSDSSANPGQVQVLSDTVDVKTWLTKVIVDYRNNEQTKTSYDQLRSEMTDDYFNYKSTDITLEYDTITNEQFHEKWKAKFQTEYVGKRGFFNWSQDCGPIEILTCRILRVVGDTEQIIHVVIRDVRWNTNSEMDVVVISKDNRTLIADVKHYD